MNVTPQHLAETLALALGGTGWTAELEKLVANSEKVTY